MSACKGLAGPGNHRHAHPQRVTRCSAARKGKWIQGNVYLPVGRHETIHCRQSGGAFVADPGNLERSRLAGEDQQPILARMSRQIEKNVDPVGADLIGQLLVAMPQNIVPGGSRGSDPSREPRRDSAPSRWPAENRRSLRRSALGLSPVRCLTAGSRGRRCRRPPG
jgi:hypothetical protein